MMRSSRDMVITLLPCLLGMALLLPTATAQPAADWTFFVYLDGDNDLEGAAITDFLEMASIGSHSNVTILVIFDRTPGYSSAYDDWTDTRRGRVDPNDVPNSAWGEGIGEANMGDPNTLIDFVQWGMRRFPAQKYAVVLWDHGNGWRDELRPFKSACSDSSDNDTLFMHEVRTALETIEANYYRVDLLGFDACLMGMVEVAYEIRGPADVMVASPEVVPPNGWPYDDILSQLIMASTMDAGDLGTVIVERYYESYGYDQTKAAIGLGWMDGLGQKVDALAHALMEEWDNDAGAIAAAAAEVMFRVHGALIAEEHGSDWPDSHGLAIYYPDNSGAFSVDYNSTIILFASDTRWDEFLLDFYAAMSGSWIADARAETQLYNPSDGRHVDLYHFCERLVEDAPGTVWTDFDYVGAFEYGTFVFPFDTLGEALDAAGDGGSICIMAGSTGETPTIGRAVTLHAVGGSVVIGAM